MLSLAKMGRGREDYHLRAVGADASQYYSERGEVAGVWLGGGAAALGMEGRVGAPALLAVLAGYQPGAQQTDTGWVGIRLVAPPRDGKRMPGIDACFKAPKSVSLLWAFGDRVRVGDRTLDQVVERAHDEAVREAMRYLEASAAKGRRGYNGLVQVGSRGFVAAAFRQRTSRANDPHLHSHVLIANMCMNAYAEHGRLYLGERDELVAAIVDDWWSARGRGEAVMQASRWSDVLELNERARERLVEAGVVEREGLDVRGVTIGVGDEVMVLRNERALGVINGTMGTVVAIDRERGDVAVRTAGAEPATVVLPATFWNAKGRRRLVLAHCRTIHKAQGATYCGESLTLAGDDTIHLEATHVALSRGTVANHLYYLGEPPPDEDHQVVEAEWPEVEGLVAAVERSRAQVMALDLLLGRDDDLPGGRAAGGGGGRTEAPMTEAQVAVLAWQGAAPERELTWVQASLLIDEATGAPRGQQAAAWLLENGASREEAAAAVKGAEEGLRAPPPQSGRSDAVEGRIEHLSELCGDGRRLSTGAAGELAALERTQEEAARSERRRQREAWARRARPAGGAEAHVEHARQAAQAARRVGR